MADVMKRETGESTGDAGEVRGILRFLAHIVTLRGRYRPRLADFFLAERPDRRADPHLVGLHDTVADRREEYRLKTEQMIERLNDDLSGELGAMIQYLTYAARVTGPLRPQLTDFFLKEIPDEQEHARFLANKIVALGGEPTTAPRPVPAAGSNREMLEAVLEAERRAVDDYGERARQAEELGDKGLAVQLEDMVRDETEHAEEAERILHDWTP